MAPCVLCWCYKKSPLTIRCLYASKPYEKSWKIICNIHDNHILASILGLHFINSADLFLDHPLIGPKSLLKWFTVRFFLHVSLVCHGYFNELYVSLIPGFGISRRSPFWLLRLLHPTSFVFAGQQSVLSNDPCHLTITTILQMTKGNSIRPSKYAIWHITSLQAMAVIASEAG